jgi:hypothetical protein
MNLRFHRDASGEPHIWAHNVTEREVFDVLLDPLEAITGRFPSIIAIGLTRAGRYLKVIYSPDDTGDGIFVITAFELPPKQVRALKKRLSRRRS